MKKPFLFLATVTCAAAIFGQTQSKPQPNASPKAATPKPAAKADAKTSALDKTTFENYVRHLFVWDHSIKVEIGDPKPSPMAGLFEVAVHASKDKASQDALFYVSKDGQHILRGDMYQTADNPFKPDLEKLKDAVMSSQIGVLEPNYGTAGAPVVIVEFSDFQCPYCKTEAKTMRTNLLTAYPKEVRLYHLDMPIESIHPWARAASIAGRCIYKQNSAAFWDYYDWIYEHQADMTVDNLKGKILDWAKDNKNIDSLQLTRCMDTKETDSEITKTIEEAKKLQVNQTPMIFVNGRRMTGAVDWPDLKRIIDDEIEYQKTAKNAGEDCGCSVSLATPGTTPATSTGGLK